MEWLPEDTPSFQTMIDTATDPWGIDIERVEVTLISDRQREIFQLNWL